MKAATRFLLFIILTNTLSSYSQTSPTREFIRLVQEADLHFYYYEDYIAAGELYAALYSSNSSNHNLAGKLGICYLNSGYRHEEAIPLLLFASGNMAANDSEYTEFGDKAPVETLYYLAFAYHITDNLDKAIEVYTDLRRTAARDGSLHVDYIDMQIEACLKAREAFNNPAELNKSLFIPFLNDFPGAMNPVVSANDSVFLFTVKKGGKTSVYCSYRSGEWSKPAEITSQLGNFPEIYSNSITADGMFLVAYVYSGGSGNLYFSRRSGNRWSRLSKFPRPVSSKYWEAHGFITPDGQRLFFASNRPGGAGELDIYITDRTEQGGWTNPVNAGNDINTPFNETAPFYDTGTTTLYFSSEGHSGIGGYDYFQSTQTGKNWSKPTMLPYPLNTTGNNIFLGLTADGTGFITTPDHPESPFGKIHRIDIVSGAAAGGGLPEPETGGSIVLVPERVSSGEFLVMKSILFGFDNSIPDDEATHELERIAGMLEGQSGLTVEVTGYTDAIGTKEYNIGLAKRRAEAAVSYLRKRTGNRITYVSKVAGATGFVAVNVNPDGTDNPAGRAYNRRVTIGVVNPGTGVTLTPGLFVPEHLRHPQSERFGILLFSSADRYYPDYFSGLGSAEMYFVRPVIRDTVYSYILGDFSDRLSANRYLRIVNEAGFENAGVISLYEISEPDAPGLAARGSAGARSSAPVYTIQLYAGIKMIDKAVFGNIEHSVLLGNDGLYRYVTGEFQGFSEARRELTKLRNSGFGDAFIRDYKLLLGQTKEIKK